MRKQALFPVIQNRFRWAFITQAYTNFDKLLWSKLRIIFSFKCTHNEILNPLASKVDIPYEFLNAFQLVVG